MEIIFMSLMTLIFMVMDGAGAEVRAMQQIARKMNDKVNNINCVNKKYENLGRSFCFIFKARDGNFRTVRLLQKPQSLLHPMLLIFYRSTLHLKFILWQISFYSFCWCLICKPCKYPSDFCLTLKITRALSRSRSVILILHYIIYFVM